MADGCIEFLVDDSKWAAASRAGRERAARMFSTERIVPMYESFYEYILESPGEDPLSVAQANNTTGSAGP